MSRLVRIGAWAVVVGVGFGCWRPAAASGWRAPLAAGLLIVASTGSLGAGVISVLGGIAWFSGNWLFALRNDYYRPPLARRVFLTALPRFDPTRRRGLPTSRPENRGSSRATDARWAWLTAQGRVRWRRRARRRTCPTAASDHADKAEREAPLKHSERPETCATGGRDDSARTCSPSGDSERELCLPA